MSHSHRPLRSHRRRHPASHGVNPFNVIPLGWSLSFIIGLIIGLNLH